jgi:hypothetical protein
MTDCCRGENKQGQHVSEAVFKTLAKVSFVDAGSDD